MGADISVGVFRRVAARSLQLLLQPPQVAGSNNGNAEPSSNAGSQQLPLPLPPAIPLPIPAFGLLNFKD